VYNAGGQLIAEYHSDPVPPAAGGGGTSYLTSDHLGSTRVVTKADGAVKARYDYLPFGEELGSGIGGRTVGMGYSAWDTTRQKFTQKERDNESGLDYFLARYYSSAQGRFTSPDPVALTVERLTDPQRINLYGYTRNNRLAFIDPTGEIITFANKEARERFEEYEKHLNEDKKKYASELQTVNQLKESDVEYQLRTGGNFQEGTEGNVTTDGNRILVGISNVGGPQGETFSLNSRFAHELEHARQFDSGEFAFFKDAKGQWRTSPASYDIGDEVKAWKAQLNNAIATDYWKNAGGTKKQSTLSLFSQAKTDDERAGVLVRNGYPNRNPHRDSNVVFSSKEGYKPGQLIRPTDRPGFFGRVH
jgi:RHS repeat-associated protein